MIAPPRLTSPVQFQNASRVAVHVPSERAAVGSGTGNSPSQRNIQLPVVVRWSHDDPPNAGEMSSDRTAARQASHFMAFSFRWGRLRSAAGHSNMVGGVSQGRGRRGLRVRVLAHRGHLIEQNQRDDDGRDGGEKEDGTASLLAPRAGSVSTGP